MGKNKGGNTKKQGPGYEGVDPIAECIIHKTCKFAVWDAPGVQQPPPPPPNNRDSIQLFPITEIGTQVQTAFGPGLVTAKRLPTSFQNGSLAIDLTDWPKVNGTSHTVYLGVSLDALDATKEPAAAMEEYFQSLRHIRNSQAPKTRPQQHSVSKEKNNSSDKKNTSSSIKQKQNNNKKFLAAAAAASTTTEGSDDKTFSFPPTAKLECTCGEVVLSLAGSPLNRLECCCMDCRKSVQWCHDKLKGPASDNSLFVDLVYFPNCLQVEQGGEYLEVFMIKEGYNMQRIVATCCGSCLMGDHPFFQETKLVAYLSTAKLTCNKTCGEIMPAQKRIFETDLSTDLQTQMNAEQPFEKPKDAKPNEETPDLNKWKAKHPRYTNLQRLITSIGPLQFMHPGYEGKEPEWNRQLRLASAAGN